MADLGMLQDLFPGLAASAPEEPRDIAAEALRRGVGMMMGSSPFAPEVESLVMRAFERYRTGMPNPILPPGVTPEMAEDARKRGAQNIAQFLGPHVSGALGLAPMPSYGPPPTGEPPLTEADLMAQFPAPQPAQQSFGLSLPPGTDLSAYNRRLAGLEGIGEKMGKAAGARKEAIGGSLKAQQDAAAKQAKIAADQQAKIAGELTDLEGALAKQQQDQQDRERSVRDAVKAKTDAFTQAVEAANSASIDPDRWYRDSEGGTFGRRLGSGIAIALGAMGAAFRRGGGGTNYAMQIIESAINRDLMAQRAEMAKKQAGVGNAQNAVALAREQFSDEKARGAAEQAAMLSRAQRMIAISTAQSGSKEEIAKGEALIAALESKAAERMAEIDQAETAREWNSQTQLAGMDLEGAKIKGADAKLRWQATAAASKAGLAMPPGLRIADPSRPPPSKEQLAEMTTKNAALRRLNAAAAGVLAERKKSGTFGGRFGPEGEMKVKELQLAYANYIGIKGEQLPKFMAEAESHGLPTSSTDLGYLPDRIKTLLDNARSAFNSSAGAYNLTLDDVQSRGGVRVDK